jgi:ribonuclease BN (tRNA processing enzyme)
VGERDPDGLTPPALYVIGCGTAAPDGERVGSGYLLETGSIRALVDCGAGVPHALAAQRRDWTRLTHLLVTHFHTDHIGGLPMLIFALKHGVRPARTAPLRIIGPAGTSALMARLADAYGPHLLAPGFPLEVDEIEVGGTRRIGELTVVSCATPHTDESLAYRIRGGGIDVGFTGDTGPSVPLARFFARTRLLVAECSLPDAEAMPMHLSPSSLAELATLAQPGALAVVHVYPQLARERVPELLRSAGWMGETCLAHDGLRLL